MAPLIATLQETLDSFVEIGLGYLSLERPSGTLSGGEAQRVKMIRHLGSSLTDVTYVFDEPTVGLHPHDIQRMNDLLLRLRDKGNTVLVVEPKPETIAIADHVVDLGPGAPDSSRDGGDAVVRRETGDQTDQESRSAGHGAATRVTAMDITIHATFLPHNDPDASLAFYRDTLGFEVRNDVGYDGMRWITVGPADQPGTSIVLEPPVADPGVTDDERRTILEMMAKGTYAGILLATADLDGAFARLQASGAEVVQEPTEQPYGVRDCAFRDPAGNLIRINELR